ncbi:MAG: PDZ domain-containing protein [Verrucomicrobiaceae bacterium]|nr:MAG: PDZ domain-containing protein [Verrucomicrobiaceae bacterium]
MKLAVTILGIALSSLTLAQETGVEPAPGAAPAQTLHGIGTPWLGLTVGRLDDAVRAHAPGVPQGIGFVVTGVAIGSPAEKAGVKAYDIFWKFDDQLIANEAQLLALLRLKKDGDEVKIGLHRSGESMTLPVILVPQKADHLLGQSAVNPAVRLDTPMKVLNPAERSATIDTADGKAVLTLVNGQSEVKIVSKSGSVIFEGPTTDAQGVSLIPNPWKPRVGALERALAHAIKAGNPPPRRRLLPSSEELK